MIIKKAEIEGFGKFSNKTFEFDKGFNLITGANEDGKTTLMAFFKMLFYSSSSKSEKGSDLFKSLRKKYRPWNGEPMAGAIEFEQGGSVWRLHKEFFRSEAGDKTTVFCKTDGEENKIKNPNEAGEHFFDMTLGEFERSVFIGQSGGFSGDASGDSLAMRIANLTVSGDESISRDVVAKRISDALEELISKSGKKGLLVDARARRDELVLSEQDYFSRMSHQQELFKEISRLEAEITENETALKSFRALQDIAVANKELNALYCIKNKFNLIQAAQNRLSHYNMPFDDLEKHIALAKKIEEQINSTLALMSELSSQTDVQAALDSEYQTVVTLEGSADALRHDLELLRSEISTAEALLDAAQKKAEKSARHIPTLILTAASAVSVACALKGLRGSQPALIFAVGLFCAALVLFGVLRRYLPKKISRRSSIRLARNDYEAQLKMLSSFNDSMTCKRTAEIEAELRGRLSETVSRLNDILKAHGCECSDALRKKTSLFKSEELTELAERLDSEKSRFTELMSALKPLDGFASAKILYGEINAYFTDIEHNSSDMKTVCEAFGIFDPSEAYINSRIKELSELIKSAPADDCRSLDVNAVEFKLKNLRQRLGECQQSVALPTLSEDELNSLVKDAKERTSELEFRYNALTLASDVMQEAALEASKGFGSHLSKKTGEYLSRLTDGRYNDVMVSRSLNVEAKNPSGNAFYEWKYLSSGAIDRIYLALRLAATDILSKAFEPLPLFLDDIFAQYDDESCRRALAFLKSYLEDGGSASQIMLFTCHGHIADSVKNTFGNIREISL